MSVNAQYQSVYNQVKDLEFRLHDLLDENNSVANEIFRAVDRLIHELEVNESPRDVEEAMKPIIKTFENLKRSEQEVMPPSQADTMFRTFEKMRQQLRGMDNY